VCNDHGCYNEADGNHEGENNRQVIGSVSVHKFAIDGE
jgi:hypothetical protein